MTARLINFWVLPALGAMVLALACPAAAQAPAPAEEPFVVADANAGTTPIQGDGVYKAFHEQAGISRMVETLVKLYRSDPRLKDIFAATDDEKLHKLLTEQICFITGGPCHYTGRDMEAAHKDMGVQQADFNALVEDLQMSMDQEKVPVWAQNRLLAKLAPMQRVIVARKGYRG